MEVRSRADAEPFTTADGSTIRVLLDAEVGGARNQSLAEATLAPGHATERHYHGKTEELYVVLAGTGELEVDGERRDVGPVDAVLLPPGAWPVAECCGPEAGTNSSCCCSVAVGLGEGAAAWPS